MMLNQNPNLVHYIPDTTKHCSPRYLAKTAFFCSGIRPIIFRIGSKSVAVLESDQAGNRTRGTLALHVTPVYARPVFVL